MKKATLFILTITLFLFIHSCKKKTYVCKCNILIDSSTEQFEQEYKNTTKAQESCNEKRNSYDSVKASYKNISCEVITN